MVIEKYNYSINRSTIYHDKSDYDVNINLSEHFDYPMLPDVQR